MKTYVHSHYVQTPPICGGLRTTQCLQCWRDPPALGGPGWFCKQTAHFEPARQCFDLMFFVALRKGRKQPIHGKAPIQMLHGIRHQLTGERIGFYIARRLR